MADRQDGLDVIVRGERREPLAAAKPGWKAPRPRPPASIGRMSVSGLRWLAVIVAALFCLEVGLMALRYLIPGSAKPAFVMANPMAHPWLYIHAAFGGAALLLGPLQFIARIRARWPRVHRWIGRSYLTACLVAGGAGLLLAAGATAGPVASVGFGGAAVVSLICAVQAWRTAVGRRFDLHRRWVIRSFAVIFAAVTLRIWLPLSQIAHLDMMTSYRIISFLAWVPNLLVAELYLARRARDARALLGGRRTRA